MAFGGRGTQKWRGTEALNKATHLIYHKK